MIRIREAAKTKPYSASMLKLYHLLLGVSWRLVRTREAAETKLYSASMLDLYYLWFGVSWRLVRTRKAAEKTCGHMRKEVYKFATCNLS